MLVCDRRTGSAKGVSGDLFGDNILIFDEQHLRWALTLYSHYYDETRTHLGLGQGRAIRSSHSTIRDHRRHTDPVRIASSVCADMIFGRDPRPLNHPNRRRLNKKLLIDRSVEPPHMMIAFLAGAQSGLSGSQTQRRGFHAGLVAD